MKVAFIHPNGHTAQLPRPPLGLLSVATICKIAGHEVRLIDANALKLEAEVVARIHAPDSEADYSGLLRLPERQSVQ